MQGNEILIVGGTGQLGSRLVPRLASLGLRPRVLVRTPEKAARLESIAEPVLGDLLDRDSLTPAFAGAERVFVLGQPTEHMQSLERNAIDAAVLGGAKRIVYLSNFTAKIGSALPPNHIHGAHEQLLANLDVEWTVLGPTRYMTNLPFDWASVLNDGVLLESGGAGTMTCIDPDDVADVAVKVLTEEGHHGKTYRMTSEDSFTAAELAALLSAHIGRPVQVIDSEPGPGYFSLVAAGAYYTTDTARHLLGRPTRSYTDWLAEHKPMQS
jgi:uncharacterized protein YbjT (DUF2867 family)